jgi:hypothetical protein
MTQKLVRTSDATALDLHTILIVGDALEDYTVESVIEQKTLVNHASKES